MEFSIKRGALSRQKTACLVVGVHAGKKLSEPARAIDKAARGAIKRVVDRGDITGKIGETLLLPDVSGVSAERVLLVGVGKQTGVSDTEFRQMVSKAAGAIKSNNIKNAISTLALTPVTDRDLAWSVNQHTLIFDAATYRFNEHKSKPAKGGFSRCGFWFEEDALAVAREALAAGRAQANGIRLTRDLGNRAANFCTPSHLADQAELLAEQFDNLSVEVLDENEMEALNMGSLLSVSQGSREPARLIAFNYQGAGSDVQPAVIVGKGVTFDSGGISIKPSAGMDEMKFDMCGAASVFGTMAAIAGMRAPMNVVGLVPATENLPDGNATKPGDIVTSMSGQTIEILNTDAEGRLILCDALTYAARFSPSVVIDIATLTGACIVALGNHASGLMSNDDGLAADLLAAGQRTGDRAWQLPLWDEYHKQLESPFADVANVGGRSAGTITAGCFLSRFTKDYRWAHIDIAGTAWTSGKSKSATGRPVQLLVDYLLTTHSV